MWISANCQKSVIKEVFQAFKKISNRIYANIFILKNEFSKKTQKSILECSHRI